MSDEQVMIFGASTRAAAQSAVRAGFRPVCADHFADEDLYDLAEVLPLSRYPQDLVTAAAGRPSLPWMYTGALENHPRLLKKLASSRTLYGNPAEVVIRVRDPLGVARVLAGAGLPFLPVCPGSQPPPQDGRWMLKPLRSAGGRGIEIWDNLSVASTTGNRREPRYFQRRVTGEPYSALFLGTSAETVLIGVTRQLIGESRLNAGDFAYCGSIGPCELAPSLEAQIGRCGQVLGSEFALRGLFGIDFLIDAESVAWLTEVNPRYTASVEVLESGLGLSLVRDHVMASATFGDAPRSREVAKGLKTRLAEARRARRGRVCGKAIIYAPFTLRSPSLVELNRDSRFALQRARIADRPRRGSLVPSRSPVCTLLVDELADAPGIEAAGSLMDLFDPALSALAAKLVANPEPLGSLDF